MTNELRCDKCGGTRTSKPHPPYKITYEGVEPHKFTSEQPEYGTGETLQEWEERQLQREQPTGSCADCVHDVVHHAMKIEGKPCAMANCPCKGWLPMGQPDSGEFSLDKEIEKAKATSIEFWKERVDILEGELRIAQQTATPVAASGALEPFVTLAADMADYLTDNSSKPVERFYRQLKAALSSPTGVPVEAVRCATVSAPCSEPELVGIWRDTGKDVYWCKEHGYEFQPATAASPEATNEGETK